MPGSFSQMMLALTPLLSGGPDDIRALGIAGAAIQCALAIVNAIALTLSRRDGATRLGWYWSAAQWSLAAALLAVIMQSVEGPWRSASAFPAVRSALSGVYFSGKMLFYLALAYGTAEVLGRRVPRSVTTGAFVGVAVLSLLFAGGWIGMPLGLRLQGVGGGLILGTSTFLLWRAERPLRTAGSRMLALAFLLYAAVSLAYGLGLRYTTEYDPSSLWRTVGFILDRTALLDLLGQFLLGVAMVALLFEQQREVARTQRTERDVLHQEAQTTAKLEAIGRVASNVAHELNNPLTAVIGAAEHLLTSNRDPAQREDLELIHRESLRCRHVARDLLLYARVPSEVSAPVPCRPLLADAMAAVRLHAATVGIQLTLDPVPDLTVQGDGIALQQVLVNLLRNAIEASPAGSTVRAFAMQEGNEIVLGIEDQGPGIAPEIRQRLFEPFVTTKGRGEGTGLGLSISGGIVRRHGGSISFESRPDETQGTRFTIRLPLGLSRPRAASEVPPERPPAPPPPATPPKPASLGWILLAEDEPGVQIVLSRFLRTRGFEVELAGNGQEAMDILRAPATSDPAVLFCDVRMPVLDGPGLIRWMKADFSDLLRRTVLLSGDTVSPGLQSLAKEVGCQLLAKPFSTEELDAVLARIPKPQPEPARQSAGPAEPTH